MPLRWKRPCRTCKERAPDLFRRLLGLVSLLFMQDLCHMRREMLNVKRETFRNVPPTEIRCVTLYVLPFTV